MESTMIHRDTDELCARIVETIAAAADTDPLALEPPLYHAVDVEALTRLVESDGLNEIRFEYEGYTVCVSGDGTVSIDGAVSER